MPSLGVVGECRLFHQHFLCCAVTALDDVDAVLRGCEAIAVYIVLSDGSGIVAAVLMDTGRSFLNEEEILPLVGGLIISDVADGHRQCAVPLVDVVQGLSAAYGWSRGAAV